MSEPKERDPKNFKHPEHEAVHEKPSARENRDAHSARSAVDDPPGNEDETLAGSNRVNRAIAENQP